MANFIGKIERPLWAVAIVVVAYMAYSLGASRAREAMRGSERIRPAIDVNVLRQQMERVSELATVSYDYTDIASHRKTERLWGIDLPFSTSTILLRYSGTIKAGVDVNAATITVRDSTVLVSMPRPRVISHSVDPRTVKILNQENGLFSSIKIADFQAFCMAHQDSMQQLAIEQGLLSEASSNVEGSLELLMAPVRAMGYTVVVKVGEEGDFTGARLE